MVLDDVKEERDRRHWITLSLKAINFENFEKVCTDCGIERCNIYTLILLGIINALIITK